jgi:hypothetical protein
VTLLNYDPNRPGWSSISGAALRFPDQSKPGIYPRNCLKFESLNQIVRFWHAACIHFGQPAKIDEPVDSSKGERYQDAAA